MAYTFGAGTGDDITLGAASITIGGTNRSSIVAGWFYPTTLTATRCYFSAGNVWSMVVDTTTSELRIITDNTTDGQWTTTGAGITTNQWWFIALLSTQFNTGPAGAHRVWIGTETQYPTMITPGVATAPVGNFSGNSNRTIGNKGTGTLAFQGDIGWVSFIASGPQDINNLFSISSSGSISAAQEQYNLIRWVVPLWLGRPYNSCQVGVHGDGFSVTHCALDNGAVVYEYNDSTSVSTVRAPTINGATYSQRQPPTDPPHNWPLQMPRVRRAA